MAIKIINRSMSIPIPDRVIGHVGDNLVEARSFELNRYYGEVDLSEFSFKLDTEIDGNKNIIDLDKTVEDDKITLAWTVYGSHVLHVGRMTIQLRAFHDDIEKWHSAQDYVIIQDSTNAPDAYSSLLPSEFEQMELRVTTLKEQAEASAQTATEQANRAQGIADEFENETLPAAIAAVEAAGQAKVDLAEQQADRVEDIIQEAEQDVLPELRQAIEDAGDAKDLLNGSIEAAGTAKSQLDGSISAAGPAKTGLDGSISSAGVAKTQLDGSISSANGIKSQLDGSITAAGQAKELLDESIATGDLAAFKDEVESFKNEYASEVGRLDGRIDTMATYIDDARVDADGHAYDSLGAHIRDILPRAHEDAAEVFDIKMAENYDAGIFRMEKYNLHGGELFYPYTTSTFSGWVSQYAAPADLTVTELKFYITARENPVTKIRVSIAVGERTDAALVFQKDLDVDIEPQEEAFLSCPIPHVRLQEGETIFIGVDSNVICSHGFGYEDYDESVSWYVTNGTFHSLSDYNDGTDKKLYVEMYGFADGVFTTDHLLDIAEDHETRIQNVEQWEGLVDQFDTEDIYINEQNPFPVLNPKTRYDYSTFIGWVCPIGRPTDFDTLIFSIKNRSTENYLENVRCIVAIGSKDGEILADEVMSDVHIAPGEWRRIVFTFSSVIENAEENELYAGFSCDQHIAYMGGDTGTVLRPPTTSDVVRYNAHENPSYTKMMRPLKDWIALYDPNQNNTNKVDFIIAKKAKRYGLGNFREPVRNLAAETAEEKIEEAMSEKATFELPPRVILPDVFHAVVGDTLQLFYRGIVEHPYPYQYNIEFRCDIGKNTARYFEVTPEAGEVGDHALQVNVRDHLDNILATGTTILRVHAVGASPEIRKNVLCVGDSLTSGGIWCREALRRLTEAGGTPAGHELSNIRFIGTKRNGPCGYEGYGGWTWASYLSAPTATNLGMWVYCSHDKDSTDQHSLWEDASGNIWSMETIEASRIKFTRYQDHTAPMPIGAGTLHHYQNATHTADIDYDETVYAEGNPFWDSDEGQVNFRTYCERNDFDRVDYMVTLLSWNGMAASTYSNSETLIANHVTNAKQLIRILHEQYPNAKVKMMGIQLPSVNGGTGHSYGANSQYSNWYGLVRSVMNMNLAYQEMANEDEFSSYVEFINISGQFDSEYNMPHQTKAVNTRSSTTEQVGTNGVHPSMDGYYQIGDAAYRALVSELTEV